MPVAVLDKQAEPTDETLFERVASGDREAFQTLYERYKGMIYNLAYRVVGNAGDAEDLLQETFLAAFRQAGSFQGRSRFSTWLASIAMNKSINLGKQKRLRLGIVKRIFGKPETEADAKPAAEETDVVQKMIQEFPQKLKTMVTLRYILNFSYEEIAESLGCAVGTVKSRLFQAHELIRKQEIEKGVKS